MIVSPALRGNRRVHIVMTQQEARAAIETDRIAARADVHVTPGGLLAIGAMVGMILLGSAAIVRAARTQPI